MNKNWEVIVVGGGVIGLAIAVELKLRGAEVAVVSRDVQQAASQAAAGMLAPMAEEIADPQMLDLCLRSRWLYPEWTSKLEHLTGVATGYLPCGILAPSDKEQGTRNEERGNKTWLDREALEFYQPGLGQEIVGAWWYPEDGQVDNRCLMRSLIQAAQNLKIEIQEGVTVQGIQQQAGNVTNIMTSQGSLTAEKYVLATGSWASQLLPLPVKPVKGQMMSLRMPHQPHEPYPLQRVLFGDNIYLVPRQDGRLIIGATVEQVDWTPHNTPQGIQNLLNKATKLYPAVANWQIEEFWWGFRPGTPDELPILGTSPCDNLYFATGHYRNGILLAPVTASLMADLILEQKSDPLLSYFSWQRFLTHSLNKTANSLNNSLSNGHNVQNGYKAHHPNSFIEIKEKSPMSIVASPLPAPNSLSASEDQPLTIAGKTFNSRLMTGTGKYPSIEAMQHSIIASGCEIVTVAVRRVQTKAAGHEGLAEAIDWQKIWMLPNTAGCKTAEEAIRVARLGREMAKLLGQEDNNFVKLEVIPDAKYLLPDPIGTLEASEQLVKEGFAVLPYINADPLLAKRLEEAGCATVMPLGSPIGSGQGIRNTANIEIIIEQSNIPVVVDAGIGSPSEAAQAMEMGADALLINSAIALAKNPIAMAQAMGLATVAGRLAYVAGRIPIKQYASASSPLTGTIK
ncbi:glycine oxidase [Xenococcus sp. PCC 7305]|uniref:glycine oxidase ThiO n=1 Tax=Xenococcus sp. PCC 7305 TaxID=102125 RepID=UPI0002ABB0F8|nr:glycine oxidase ThiO [Xenococcus sp. PCC 7305]ELS00641.1 glycine oxidase [Xenococcus sp. PCC 7305]